MQGNRPQRPSWFVLLFMAIVIPLWVMMFLMFLNPKKTQQRQQPAPKTFPTLQEIRRNLDINQAIKDWNQQVQANPKSPDADVTLLKVAIADEYVLQPPNYRAAFHAYRKLGEQYGRSPFATHALFRAAQLAEQQLGDGEVARKLYERIGGRRGQPTQAVVWQLSGDQFVPSLQGQALTTEVHRILDEHYRNTALYRALSLLVRFCGNDKRYSYGLALLLTAILVQGFLWLLPFTRRQYETMRKMQEMQPELKKIQEAFKGDPRRMQTEMFSLYKRHHFNPLTGCFLGMLIQFPFLIAVYSGIRHFQYPLLDASFLWIKSLGQADMPLLVLYCGSQYLQMRYGPGSDPSQAQQQKTMAWLMPVMFFVFFRGFPSGFLLYWMATNLLSMVQRYLIMRKPSEAVGVRVQPTGATVEQANPVPVPAFTSASDPHGSDFATTEQLPALSDGNRISESNEVNPEPASDPNQYSAPAAQRGETSRAAPLSRGTRRGGRRRKRNLVSGKKKG